MMLAALVSLIAAPSQPWTLVAGGDVMLYAMDPRRPALSQIAPAFRAADVAYANLEIPLTTAKTPTRAKSAEDLKARRQFILRADPRHITQLKGLGLDLVSLANNHTMDFGPAGMRETMRLLDKAGIAHSGAGETRAEAERVAVKRLPNGLRVGMISFLGFIGGGAIAKCGPAGEKTPGIAALAFNGNLNDAARTRLRRLVAQARQQADVVLVALHWGLERETKPTLYQTQLGRAWIEAGADAVLGAHPHTLQGREVYLGKPILYSMGNLISPLPARSAVYTLKFDGRTFKSWSVRPMDNRGAKAVWLPAKQEPARRQQIEALDRLVPKPKRKPRLAATPR